MWPLHANAGRLQKFEPLKSALRFHSSDSLKAGAHRARDPEKFKEAVRLNLEAKRDFAAGYQGMYPHNTERSERGKYRDASTGASASPAEFCRQYGFALRSVEGCPCAPGPFPPFTAPSRSVRHFSQIDHPMMP